PSGHFVGGDHVKHLTHGPVAKHVDLAGQYRLRHDGDLARRMGLHHGPGGHLSSAGRVVRYPGHGGFHHGPIHPRYAKHGFSWHSRWPSYYTAFYGHRPYVYWYPRWSSWVRWSWYYNCLPVWDPRPLWCRPWIYVSCPMWVYWETPVWQPLPVVVSGTWVDVAKVEMPADDFDLQLMAVRFVDPGHPDEKLGPRYRVWVRNNSAVAIDRPFDVVLLAGNDDKAAPELPWAGIRIDAIGAGETRAVDIRLPFDVQTMGRDEQGRPAPFSTLHVLVDGNRAIDEISEVNNGTTLAADLVLPVDPSAFEVQPKEVEAGGELLLAGEGLGPEPGRVIVHLGGIEMDAEIIGWYDLGVSLKAPALPLAAPTEAELIVLRRDGVATNPVAVTIKPKAAGGVAIPEAAAPEAAPEAVAPGPAVPAPELPKAAVPEAQPPEEIAPIGPEPNVP
ncbi:MAG: hypothetical protein JW719_08925, partial [Pirellulales bacterium]|nr:hypothetical protein [Pirellulales bacterium]